MRAGSVSFMEEGFIRASVSAVVYFCENAHGTESSCVEGCAAVPGAIGGSRGGGSISMGTWAGEEAGWLFLGGELDAFWLLLLVSAGNG